MTVQTNEDSNPSQEVGLTASQGGDSRLDWPTPDLVDLIVKYETRLEITHEWASDTLRSASPWLKIKIPEADRPFAIDGITARDSTIDLLKDSLDSQSKLISDLLILLGKKHLGPVVLDLRRKIAALEDEKAVRPNSLNHR